MAVSQHLSCSSQHHIRFRKAFSNHQRPLQLLGRRHVQQARISVGFQPVCSSLLYRTASSFQAWVSEYQNSIVPATSLVSGSNVDVEPALPVYVALGLDSGLYNGTAVSYEALKAGLKAMKGTGVHGVVVEIWWGLVEANAPAQYDWSIYAVIFKTLRELGLKGKAALCFHSSREAPLPRWVLEAGEMDPDIFYTDRNGNRRKECLSLGIDSVPALHGRTAVDVYRDFMLSFKEEFQQLFGSCITGAIIGLGPDGELKYPAQPLDAGWAFPGVGEFQCYDRFMLASLRACAEAVNQPSWGLGGPHDAGTYCQWPHQSGFFRHNGSWSSPYGSFFLQWYASSLNLHADTVLGCASTVFDNTGLRLSAKLPSVYWWYNHTCHAAEMTAGINNSLYRDGYLPIMKCLQRWNVQAELLCADMSSDDQPDYALCDPEKLLLQQRTAAAALHVPVGLNNTMSRLDEAAFNRIEYNAFASLSHAGIQLPLAQTITMLRVSSEVFDPVPWETLSNFMRRVQQREEKLHDEDSSLSAFTMRSFADAAAAGSVLATPSSATQREAVHTAAAWV